MKQLSYGRSEEYLKLFKEFKGNSKHFESKVSEVQVTYEEFLTNYKAEIFFSFEKIDSQEEFLKIQRINIELKFMETKKTVLLKEFFNHEELKVEFEKSCHKTVDNFEMKREQLKL